MRVLITGAAGFVGRAFVEHYLLNDDDVDMIDIKVGCHDARSFFRTSDEKYDLVIHCAAVVGGRMMIDGAPLQLAVEDLTIDAEMFRWALRTRPGRVVYFSSSAVYPIHLQADSGEAVNLHEYHTNAVFGGHADQTYGLVKQVGERLAKEANGIGIKTFVFRPFSGYGELQDDTYPFPAIMKRCLDMLRPVTIWSNAVRDFVHIDDIVGAVVAALDHDAMGPVNICTGRPTSFRQLADIAGRQDVLIEAGKPQGVAYRVGDPTLLNTFYTPKVSLEEGVARALAHFQ